MSVPEKMPVAEKTAVARPRPLAAVEPLHEGRRIARSGLILIAVFFGGLGLWSLFAPLSGAVIVPGVVKVFSERKTVQHREGGIVKEILVKNGDRVKRGQPVILLEEVQVSAVVELLRQQLDAELAKAARLAAEAGRRPAIAFPEALLARRGAPKVAVTLRSEQAQFDARRTLLDSQVSLLRSQMRQIEEEIRGLSSQVRSADEYVALMREELRMNEQLYEKNFVAYPRLLEIKRRLAEKEEKRGEYHSLIAQGKQKLSEIELRVATLLANYVREATDLLKESERTIADLREKLRPAEDAFERLEIAAPIDGEVVGLRVFTAGGVIGPREPLMDIVPLDAPLVVEGKMQVQDIDEVRVGQKAEVMFSAYKRRTTRMVDGKVTYLSADRLAETAPGSPAPYYFLVHVEVGKAELKSLGSDIQLTPGMPAEAYIKTRERPAIMYLLEPVTDTLRKAFRES